MFSKFILNTILLFSVSTVFAQTDGGQKVNTKLIKVTNKVYMLQGKGGNIGLSFGKDGVFMIDDQYADGIEQIQNEIESEVTYDTAFELTKRIFGKRYDELEISEYDMRGLKFVNKAVASEKDYGKKSEMQFEQ